MANTLINTLVIFTLFAVVFAQQGSTTFPTADPSWNQFQIKSCCPTGFNQVWNYCVRCAAPLFFDPIDSKCKPCPADHTYSKLTGRCQCFKCEAPRQTNPATNQCECPLLNKIQMLYKQDTNECICPSNLPLWNGKYCVACPSGTEYDPKQKQCYHCPEGFVRDIASHACVPGL